MTIISSSGSGSGSLDSQYDVIFRDALVVSGTLTIAGAAIVAIEPSITGLQVSTIAPGSTLEVFA